MLWVVVVVVGFGNIIPFMVMVVVVIVLESGVVTVCLSSV